MESINIGKYSFTTKELAQQMISEQQGQGHTFVELGFLIKTPATTDVDGNILTEATYSSKYSVDVLWVNLETHPDGWLQYYNDFDNDSYHQFLGLNYNDFKFNIII